MPDRLGRLSSTHAGTQRYMPDSLQGMWSLERSRTKLLLTLALLASRDCALSKVGSDSEEAFWPWRKLISGDTSSSLDLPQCLHLFWAWESLSKMKRLLSEYFRPNEPFSDLVSPLQLLLNIQLFMLLKLHLFDPFSPIVPVLPKLSTSFCWKWKRKERSQEWRSANHSGVGRKSGQWWKRKSV